MAPGQRLLETLWYVHPLTVLTVQAAPVECLKVLTTAARPSQQRLHLRNLFAEGRRYYVQPVTDGFRLTCDSKIPWRRGRTTIAALMLGKFSPAGDNGTRLDLRARMHLRYLLDIFIVPSFITSILVFIPWSPWLISLLVVVLYGLSWFSHRMNAAMQATEMLYFVQKALEDLAPYQTPALGAASADVVTPDFREEWNRFYHQQKNNHPVD